MIDFKKIKLNGRYSYKDGFYYIYNGGSGFSFKMKGKSFSLLFDSNPVDSYFYVIIDRDYNNKQKYLTSKKELTIHLDGETHYVDIVKANEAIDVTLKLLDLSIDGELLDYDNHYSFRVKVIGDSTIAGYGILQHNGEGNIHNSDAVLDFCYHALYENNADVDVLSASGWGLTFSIYTCPQNMGIIDYIDKVAMGKNDDWLDNSKYDLLILSVGTNDNSYIQSNPSLKQERINEYIENYKALLNKEIATNKDIKILMVYGTLKEEDAYYLSEETYKCLKPFYKNLFVHKFNGDNSGISNHAYVTAHDKMAAELKEVIKSLLD